MKKHTWVTVGILVGLVVGAIVGEVIYQSLDADSRGPVADHLKFFGSVMFVNLLKMVLMPLVMSSVIVGVASLNPAHLGRVGGLTVLYYMSTMAAAVLLGVVLVSVIEPGGGFPEDFRAERVAEFETQAAAGTTTTSRIEGASGTGLWGALQNILNQLIPANPIGAMANAQILPLISFSIIVGLAISFVGEPAKPVLRFFEGVFAIVMRLVDWILLVAPFGVALLVAYTVVSIGLANLLGPLAKYALTVFLGLMIHALIVLPLVLWLFGRTHPYRYLWQVKDALMTAFGTDSSSATLPVTIDVTQKYGGVNKKSAEFVLPLGATINMDGTALYEAVAVVFLFQAFGIPLGPTELAIVVLTATLAAVGAAGIPSAGLVTMVIVVEAVNGTLPPGVAALPLAAIGIILGIDRMLDMCRTTVNVWGDAVGAKIISPLVEEPGDDASPAP